MTISQANRVASDYNLNIEISGNNLSNSSVVAYRQSVEPKTSVEVGAVITVGFKNINSVLD